MNLQDIITEMTTSGTEKLTYEFVNGFRVTIEKIDPTDYGRIYAKELASRGISKTEIAQRLGVSRQTVHTWIKA